MHRISLSLLAVVSGWAGSGAEAQVGFKKNVEVLSRIPLSALSKEKKAGWQVYTGVVTARDSALRAIEAAPYGEEVERRAPGQGRKLLALAADLSRGEDGGSEADSLLAIRSYKGRDYLRLDLGTGAGHSGQTPPSQGELVTAAVNRQVLGAAKALAAALPPGATIDGLKLDLRLPPRRAGARSTLPEEARLEIYFSLGPLRGFADDELTSQQLIDAAVVLLDGNRIQVDLSR
ncbi:MAG: hypothetical protein H0T50_04265 [Gemmatimonadales bacterium]|nr:hypothetical protein [Gemmatimonadales bacterium]